MPPVLPRAGFPLAASLAPVVVSGGIWALTGSPYSLLFALLGPVVAAGSMLDGRRQRRRAVRRDRELALAAVDRVRGQVESVHARERARLDRLAPELDSVLDPRRVVEAWSREPAALPVRLGRDRLDAVVELTGDPDPDAPPELATALQAVRAVASGVDGAPWVVDAREGIGVVGPISVARAVARALAVQLLAQCSPATFSLLASDDEPWVSALPHRTAHSEEQSFRVRDGAAEVVIAWGSRPAELRAGLGTVIRLGERDIPPTAPAPSSALPSALGRRRAREAAGLLAELAHRHGVLVATDALPESISLSALLAVAPRVPGGGGLRAPIGMGAHGVVELDLVGEGPHAVVAGTTGTGKSELLVSWVLAMASRHPVSELTFLLIDFKGGAAFAPLAGVPHVVGIVSDLDARRSRRAIESLRAELRRRERVLAERGARSIEELDGRLARLVIVVDEFAAVVSGRPELHDVFADLAARGRSLGLHLVLCTQRPAGVVRDGVLANVTLRISLRVTDRGDSSAMLGSDAAFALPPTPRGRAVIADGTGTVREVQLALAGPADADRLRSSPLGDASAAGQRAPVWRDPLPEVLGLDELRRAPDWSNAEGIPFGRLDLPSEQRQPLAVHDPAAGHVLVLGAARAGRSTALATFAADARCRVLPRDPADAWTVLAGLAALDPAISGASDQTVLLIDDLDVLVDAVDADARHEFIELLTRLARESRRLTLIVSAQRLTAPLQRLAGLFDARLLLRQSSRDEHVLAGGDGAEFDPQSPPGAGSWRSGSSAPAIVQVAISDRPMPRAEVPELPRVRPEPGVPLALVAGRPREVLGRLQAEGSGGIPRMRVVSLGETTAPVESGLWRGGGDPTVLLGDPDAWQAEWGLLTSVRREIPLVFVGCTAGELRAIARVRETPPPLGGRPGECWVVDGGVVRRAILDTAGGGPGD